MSRCTSLCPCSHQQAPSLAHCLLALIPHWVCIWDVCTAGIDASLADVMDPSTVCGLLKLSLRKLEQPHAGMTELHPHMAPHLDNLFQGNTLTRADTCIHTHTNTQTCKLTYIQTYIHTYIQTYIHTYTCAHTCSGEHELPVDRKSAQRLLRAIDGGSVTEKQLRRTRK